MEKGVFVLHRLDSGGAGRGGGRKRKGQKVGREMQSGGEVVEKGTAPGLDFFSFVPCVIGQFLCLALSWWDAARQRAS